MDTADDKFFSEIVNNIPGFVFQLCYKDNGVTKWNHINKKGIEMLKMPADIVGKENKLGERVHKSYRENFLDSIQQSVKKLSKWDHEFLCDLPDGSQIWLHGIATPIRKGDETILDGVAFDISKQKKQEERVIKEKLYSEQLINSLPGMFYYYEVDGPNFTLQKWNKNHETVTGYTSAELKGKDVFEFFNKTEHKRIEDALDKMAEKGSVSLEANLRLQNGEIRPYHFESYYFKDAEKPYFLGMGMDISERIEADKALRRSEQKYRKLYTETPVMMHSIDNKGEIISVSSKWLEVLGYKQEEVIGRKSVDFLTEESKKQVQAVIMPQLFKSGSINDSELQFSKKSGEIVNVLLSAISIKDDKGNVLQSLAVLIDVTKRKHAEEALERSEMMYRTLFAGAGDAIMILSGDSSIIECNQSALTMFGYDSFDKLIGKSPWDISPEKQPDGSLSVETGSIFIAESKLGVPRSFEWVHKRKNGNRFDVEVSLIKILLKDEPFLIAIIRDITNRKHAEHALKENEIRLRDAQRIARFGYWDLDIVNDTLKWSDEIYEMFGLKPKEFEATFEAFLGNIHPDDRDMVTKAYSDSLKTKSAYSIEHRLKLRDGTIKYVHERCESLFDNKGNPLRSLGTVQDITEQKQIENEVLEAKRFSDAMINSLPGIFYVYEDYERLVQWNRNHETMTGYSSEELLNMSPFDFFTGEDKEKAIKAVEMVVEEGTVDVELALLNKNGTKTPYLLTGTRFNMNGKEYFCGFGLDIVERRKTEKELEIHREHLEELVKERTEELGVTGLELKKLSEAVEQSYATVVITDRDGNIEFANPNFTRTTGYSIEEALNKNPRILKSGKMPDSHYKEMWDTIISGKIWKGEFLNKKKNDELYWESAIISPIISEQGEITHFVAVKEDISERKDVEEELSIFKEFAESSSEGFGMASLTSEIIYMNRTLCDMLENDDIDIAAPFIKYYTDESANILRKDIIPETQTKGQWQGELNMLTSKGNIVPAYHNFFILKDTHGQPIRMAAVITDITKRKEIEEVLRQFKIFADTTTEGFGMADLEGNILYQNRGLNDLLEEKETPVGLPLLKYFTPESMELYKKEIDGSLSKKGNWQGEIEIQTVRNSVVPVYMNLFFLMNAIGKPVTLAAVITDITKRKEIEAELVQAKTDAEQANQSKSDFLANMSHEIRTPMNSILGFSELMGTKVTDKQLLSYIESIRSSGKSLLALINDILDLSKVEAGKLELHYDYVHTQSFFNEVINIFRPRIEEKGLDLKYVLPEKMPRGILIDELRLRQVILNLLSNAVKFTDGGHVEFKVEMMPEIQKSKLTNISITVEDTGKGMTKKFIGQLFQSFHQEDTRTTRRYGGTGLGLAISKNLIELMGGSISAESILNKSSKFRIVLTNIKTTSEIVEPAEIETITPDRIKFGECKALIVDDNPEMRKYFNEVLPEFGISVMHAKNGREALREISKELPDIILTDIKMPVMDGYELIREVRKDKIMNKIPVISMSASVMKESIDKIYSHDFNSFLMKPIQFNELINELMKYLPYDLLEEDRTETVDIIYDEDQLKELPAIIQQIETEYIPIWNKIKDKQPVKEVGKFGNGLLSLGNESGIEIIKEYGTNIINSTKSFDIEAIRKYVFEFPDLINELKLIIKN